MLQLILSVGWKMLCSCDLKIVGASYTRGYEPLLYQYLSSNNILSGVCLFCRPPDSTSVHHG